MRSSTPLALVVTTVLLAAPGSASTASEQPQREWRIELGVRTGYAFPMGEALTRLPLEDYNTGFVPVWIDAGVRLSPRWYVGFYGQSSLVALGPPDAGRVSPFDRLVVQMLRRFVLHAGVSAQLHVRNEEGPVDPWVGLGVGYESAGWLGGGELLPQLGVNFRVAGWLSIGPFLSCSIGRYAFGPVLLNRDLSPTAAAFPVKGEVHEWLTAGFRGVIDL
ncbi:MAG: hypothetical protein ACYC8T_16070 [Myxococcaceae bacterium]